MINSYKIKERFLTTELMVYGLHGELTPRHTDLGFVKALDYHAKTLQSHLPTPAYASQVTPAGEWDKLRMKVK